MKYAYFLVVDDEEIGGYERRPQPRPGRALPLRRARTRRETTLSSGFQRGCAQGLGLALAASARFDLIVAAGVRELVAVDCKRGGYTFRCQLVRLRQQVHVDA